MSDFLSQEEVDALLRGVTEEADQPIPAEPTPGAMLPYDLTNQDRIARSRLPTLELIHERFTRCLRDGLFNYLQRSVEVSAGPIKIQKYSDFTRNLAVPTNLNLVQAKPLRGTGLVVLDPNLVFLVVDTMFGGDGRFHTRAEGREFTLTEQRIIQGLLGTIFAEYEKAWEPVSKLRFEFVRSEMNPQFVNIATPTEMVVATSFTVDFGGTPAEMHLCLPYAMLEPVRELLQAPLKGDQVAQDRRWTGKLSRQLQEAELTLVTTLGGATLTLRDITHMKPGDVIPLTIPEFLQAAVDGVAVLEGRYGTRNGHYAIQVERLLGTEEADAPPPSPGAQNG